MVPLSLLTAKFSRATEPNAPLFVSLADIQTEETIMAQNTKRDASPKGKDAKPSAKAQPTGIGQLTGNPSAAPSKSGANVKPHPGDKPKGR
jgi:hypothetical protein